MDVTNKLPTEGRASIEAKPVRLVEGYTNRPAEAGEAIAALQIQAMEQAYQERIARGTAMFAQSKLTTAPEEIGAAVADLRADGMRAAILGFAWRWPLIGGSISCACLLFGLGYAIALSALVAAVPVSCILVVL